MFAFVLRFSLLILKEYSCFYASLHVTLNVVFVFTLSTVCLLVLLSFKVFGINIRKYSELCFVMFEAVCGISLQKV